MKDVIKYAGKVHLVFEPLVGVKALERLWVLYELATNLESCGELSLGFSKKARDDLVGIAQDLTKKQEVGFGTQTSRGGAKAGAKAVDKVVYSIKSESAKATIKEDETRIRKYIKDKGGGFSAFDEHIKNHLMDVFDSTKWALRCEGCKTQARARPLKYPAHPASARSARRRHHQRHLLSPGEPNALARGGAATLNRAQGCLPPPSQAG